MGVRLSSLLLTTFFALAVPVSVGAGQTTGKCVVDRLEYLSAHLSKAYELIETIPPSIVRGEKTPGWNDFDLLVRIIDHLKQGKDEVEKAGKMRSLKLALRSIERTLPDNPELVAFRDLTPYDRGDVPYEPGEYELKKEYQSLLRDLDRELPAELRIPGVRLPRDRRRPELISQAEQMLSKQNQRFQKRFSLTGFSSYDKLREAIYSFNDLARKYAQDLESERVEFAMARPENARWWVPRVGFQNTRTVGGKGGNYADERDVAEALFIGEDLETYRAHDDEFKVKNGYLRPNPNLGHTDNPNVSTYGSDIYIFKKDHVRDRLTWTSGNSLGQQSKAPHDGMPAVDWHGFMVPWKYRLVALPDLLENLATNKIGFIPAKPKHSLTGTNFKEVAKPSEEPLPPEPKHPVQEPLLPAQRPPMQNLPPRPVAPRAPQYHFTQVPDSFAATRRVGPLMPPLRDGQTFLEAKQELEQTPEFKKYQSWRDRRKAIRSKKEQADDEAYAIIRNKFEASPEYQAYQAQLAAFNAAVDVRSNELKASQAWADYQVIVDKNKEISAINQARVDAWKQSEEYKKYESDLAAAKAKKLEAQAAYEKTRAYELEQWVNYNVGIDPNFLFRGTSLEGFRGPRSSLYIELQYWGPIGLEDVEAFEFKKNPPSGEFLEALLKHGIQIRDARAFPVKIWHPGEP